MIRTIYRWYAVHAQPERRERLIENFQEEVNAHIGTGWNILTCGMNESFIFAIVEKDLGGKKLTDEQRKSIGDPKWHPHSVKAWIRKACEFGLSDGKILIAILNDFAVE